jgi:hypothetical protein
MQIVYELATPIETPLTAAELASYVEKYGQYAVAFGTTRQNGTPTPTAPVALQNRTDVVQTMSLSTPNGLPGIPVASGGNYTDTSGLQWVCDWVDSGTGERVQNVGEWVFNGDENWKYSAPYFYLYGLNDIVPTSGANDYPPLMCDHYETKTANQVSSAASAYNQIGITHRASELRINNHTADLNAFKAQLKASPIRVLYQLNTPIRTPLSAEDLAAYAALHTYSPNTTIYNDGGAEMDVKYMAFYN